MFLGRYKNSYTNLGTPHLARRSDEAYSPPRRPKWRFGFGDLTTENARALRFVAGVVAPARPL